MTGRSELLVAARAGDIIRITDLAQLPDTRFDAREDLVAAVEGASALGVLTVASAGNSADKPYVTGTPARTSSLWLTRAMSHSSKWWT
mgnify:CR=1 FL=1